jgi:hypothetical protein
VARWWLWRLARRGLASLTNCRPAEENLFIAEQRSGFRLIPDELAAIQNPTGQTFLTLNEIFQAATASVPADGSIPSILT